MASIQTGHEENLATELLVVTRHEFRCGVRV